MPNLPSGTVTFVFTDVAGSTALLKRLGDDLYAQVLATHRRLVREAFAALGGQEIDTQGDAFFYSFVRAREAVAAAVAVQRAHAEHAWPDGEPVRVRIGLHTGEPQVGDEGYTGLDVVRAARIAAVGEGGQTLLSDTTSALVGDRLPDGVEIRALGERRLKDIDRPEPLHELLIEGLTHVEAAPRPAPLSASLPAPPSAPPAAPGPPHAASPDVAAFVSHTREQIEERVLGELQRSFGEGLPGLHNVTAGGSSLPSDVLERRPERRSRRRSLSAEIARLRALREGGALTDEQYTRAVDRMIEAGGVPDSLPTGGGPETADQAGDDES